MVIINSKGKNKKQDFIMPDNIVKSIQKVLMPSQELSKSLTKILMPSQELSKSLNKILMPFLEQFRKFSKRLSGIDEKIKECMLESGWWITPSLMRVPTNCLCQAASAYLKGNKAAITNLFRKIYQRENCKYLEDVVINWNKNKLFLCWQDHIADAIDSHKKKKYTLSVPVLLLVAEGIATDFCKKTGIYKEKNRSSGGKKIKKILEYGKSNNPLVSYVDLLINAMDTNIYQDTNKIRKKLHTNILNRHAILHGLKRNYGTMKISLQAFMLLDVLSEFR